MIWLFICSCWGLAIAINAPEESGTIENVIIAFPLTAIVSVLGTLNLMRIVPLPSDATRFGMALKPWIPLGLLKFIWGTFLFTASSGLIFSLLGVGHALWIHLHLFSAASGGLVGVWGACYVYRRFHAA